MNNRFISKHKNIFVKIIDTIFTVSMAIFITISHGEENFVGTHAFKFFAATFMAFGLLLYTLKKLSRTEMLLDVVFKVVAITGISIITATLTASNIDFSGLNSAFYLLFIILLYSILNKKSKWRINGEDKICSSKEFLQYRYSKTISYMPTILIFIALLIPGIFNFTTTGFVISMSIGYSIELLVVYIADKIYPTGPSNTDINEN
ncbi:hypothetical protein [Lysinibacillus sp. FSL W8-0953]|uniref:hypothetical protein n=1 Tax=Lysinibacillus sp. FSL W8-0953 TaxID=2954640 RepID=UPI0030F4F769